MFVLLLLLVVITGMYDMSQKEEKSLIRTKSISISPGTSVYTILLEVIRIDVK